MGGTNSNWCPLSVPSFFRSVFPYVQKNNAVSYVVGWAELGALEKGEPPAVGKALGSFVTDSVMGFAPGALGRFLQNLGTSSSFSSPPNRRSGSSHSLAHSCCLSAGISLGWAVAANRVQPFRPSLG